MLQHKIGELMVGSRHRFMKRSRGHQTRPIATGRIYEVQNFLPVNYTLEDDVATLHVSRSEPEISSWHTTCLAKCGKT
ncbi:MAG: hypothetical protein WKF92_16560 [Pyrinomonadaceae bacterium]